MVDMVSACRGEGFKHLVQRRKGLLARQSEPDAQHLPGSHVADGNQLSASTIACGTSKRLQGLGENLFTPAAVIVPAELRRRSDGRRRRLLTEHLEHQPPLCLVVLDEV